MVLVHGFASSAEHNWRRPGWLDLLADDGREAIAVDLPGHGRAPHPGSPAGSLPGSPAGSLPGSPAGLPEAHVAAAIGGRELVDAVGFSAGARVLLRMAAAEPQRFRRLVLIGVGPGVLAPADPGPVIAALAGEHDPEDVRGMVLRRLADSAHNDRAALIAFLRLPQPPLTAAALAGLRGPVLVVLGDRDPAGPGDGLVAMLPAAQLVTLPGVDHFGTTGDVRCMDAVLRFLARPGPARPGPARPC